eukprot:gene1216-2694_t
MGRTCGSNMCSGFGPGITSTNPDAAVQQCAYDFSSPNIFSFPERSPDPDGASVYGNDPFEYLLGDLSAISDHIHRMVEQDHPVVNTAAKYLLTLGKRFRPVVVLLMGYAAMEDPVAAQKLHAEPKTNLDFFDGPNCFERQLRLAEISELIHTASLIHDDILDNSSTRRGDKSLHTVVGNKALRCSDVLVAVLAGDFLLARACGWLSTLEHHQVTKLMARVVEDLVLGEIMQMESVTLHSFFTTRRYIVTHISLGSQHQLWPVKWSPGVSDMDTYLKKNYYKTASLIAHSAQSAALLSGSRHDQAAFSYGHHLGVAYQTMDDILDWTSTSADLGKPAAMSDLSQGIMTLPVLLAAQRVARVDTLVRKKFLSQEEIQYIADTVQAEGTVEQACGVAKDE